MFDVKIAQCVTGYWLVSDRLILVKIKGEHFNTALMQAHDPMTDSTDEDINKFCEDLYSAKNTCKSQDIGIVMGI